MNRIGYIAGWGFVAISAVLLFREARPDLYDPIEPAVAWPLGIDGSAASVWFDRIRPSCNALEVELAMRTAPAPEGWEGAGFAAACWAVAGRIDRSRERIMALPEGKREAAAGIVFDVGHPIADMGDDRSAGPIMELVVEFQPWNYMALYHAGMSRYATGRSADARKHLTAFLDRYSLDDGWRRNAIDVLRRIDREARS